MEEITYIRPRSKDYYQWLPFEYKKHPDGRWLSAIANLTWPYYKFRELVDNPDNIVRIKLKDQQQILHK